MNDVAPPPSTGRLDQAMNELERALRSGSAEPTLLKELGWDPARASGLLEAYQRAKATAQRQQERTDIPTGVSETPEERPGISPPLQADDRTIVGRQLGTSYGRRQDATRELMEPGRQRVAPKYRSLLEAYYRSVSSQPAP